MELNTIEKPRSLQQTACKAFLIAFALQMFGLLGIQTLELVGLVSLEMTLFDVFSRIYDPGITLFMCVIPQHWQLRGNVLLGLSSLIAAFALYSLAPVCIVVIAHVLRKKPAVANNTST